MGFVLFYDYQGCELCPAVSRELDLLYQILILGQHPRNKELGIDHLEF